MPYTPGGISIGAYNQIALGIFLMATIGYHVSYNIVSRLSPLDTVKGKIHRYRKDWIENILRDQRTILAVQAVRNQIMATTWLASSVLLVLAFFLTSTLTGSSDPLHDNALFTVLGVQDFGWLAYKVYLLLLSLGFSFLMFLFSIRHVVLFNQLVGVTPELIEQVEGMGAADYLAILANRSASRFTYGLRGMYFALPLIAWMFSTTAFIIITVLIWAWLYFMLDTRRRPRIPQHAVS